MKPLASGNQPLKLERAATVRLHQGLGYSSATAKAAQIVEEHAWTERKSRTRNVLWKVWLEFCTANGQNLTPVTKAHFAAFLGWIIEENEANHRRIRASSLPKYISDVQQRQFCSYGH